MKKLNNFKWFTLGVAVCLILSMMVFPAMAASFSKTAELVYNNIKITLNGDAITPKDASGNTVEPFIIDGTTYLPVRAIGDALGMNVKWDTGANTVVLSYENAGNQDGAICAVQVLGYYEIIEEKFEELQTDFGTMRDDINWVMSTTITEGPYKGQRLCSAAVEQLQEDIKLVEGHYANCQSILSDEGKDLWIEYKRLANLSMSYYKGLEVNPNQSFIDRVVGASQENIISSQLAIMAADVQFWDTYQNAF